MKKVYEVIRDGSLEQTFEKSREGMNDALELVEQLAIDWMDGYDLLEIVCTEYNARGEIVACEQVQEFEDDSIENDMSEAMDAEFDSAMTSAETYGADF